MKKIVKSVFYGCNLSSEPLNESTAEELKNRLEEKGISSYIEDAES